MKVLAFARPEGKPAQPVGKPAWPEGKLVLATSLFRRPRETPPIPRLGRWDLPKWYRQRALSRLKEVWGMVY